MKFEMSDLKACTYVVARSGDYRDALKEFSNDNVYDALDRAQIECRDKNNYHSVMGDDERYDVYRVGLNITLA